MFVLSDSVAAALDHNRQKIIQFNTTILQFIKSAEALVSFLFFSFF